MPLVMNTPAEIEAECALVKEEYRGKLRRLRAYLKVAIDQANARLGEQVYPAEEDDTA